MQDGDDGEKKEGQNLCRVKGEAHKLVEGHNPTKLGLILTVAEKTSGEVIPTEISGNGSG